MIMTLTIATTIKYTHLTHVDTQKNEYNYPKGNGSKSLGRRKNQRDLNGDAGSAGNCNEL